MKRLSIILLSFVALTVAAFASSQPASIQKPDFAFPQQVSKNAEQSLATALKAGNDVDALKAMIDLALAQGMIDSDDLPAIYKIIVASAPKLKTPSGHALCHLLQAEILYSVYQSKRYSYDQRKVPLTPLPEKWAEWSGDQFRNEIERLLDAALANPATLKQTPISDYSRILTLNRESEIYFPTIYDFIINRSISIFSSYPLHYNLPASLLDSIASGDKFEVPNSSITAKIVSLYSDLIAAGRPSSAPHINALLDCLRFVVDHSQQTYSQYINILKNLYSRLFPLTEYSGDILLKLSPSNFDKQNEYFYNLQQFSNQYPSYWRIDCIKSKIFDLEKPSIQFRIDEYVYPEAEITAKIQWRNVNTIFFDVYRVNSNDAYDIKLESPAPVFRKKITSAQKIPFVTDDSVKFKLSKTGYYLITVTTDGKVPNKNNRQRAGKILTCTSVALGSISGSDSRVFSFNPLSGSPLDNVDLFTKNKNLSQEIGKTDKNAMAVIPESVFGKSNHIAIYPRVNDDIYGIHTDIYLHKKIANSKQIRNISFCDLPVYHPGDTINWETVIYCLEKEHSSTVSDFKISAIMRNANSQPVDTLYATTDEFGRAVGSFHIPEGELTGSYNIDFVALQKPEPAVIVGLSSLNFLVSDYKMPTFRVEMQKPAMNIPANGDATVRGRVVALSGVGVANTKVKIELSALPRFRYMYGYATSDPFFTDSVTTTADGSFSCALPSAILDMNPIANGGYNVRVDATSLSGETQKADISFCRGAAFTISAYLIGSPYSSDVFENSSPIKIKTEVVDAFGEKINEPVRLNIVKADDYNDDDDTEETEETPLLTILLKPGTQQVDLSSLQPGEYVFKFTMANESLVKYSNTDSKTYTLFRLNDSRSPSEGILWLASNKLNRELQRGEKARIIYGVPSDSHLAYLLSEGENIIDFRWINAKQGVHQFEVSLPDSIKSASVYLSTCKNFNVTTVRENISIAEDKLQIKCETFRDKLIPGAEETWSFKIVNNDSEPQRAAMALGMYNAALDKFRSLKWPYDFLSYLKYSENNIRINSDLFNYSYNFSVGNIGKTNPYNCRSLSAPVFETYGYYFGRSYPTSRMLSKKMVTAAGIKANSLSTPDDRTFDAVEVMEAADEESDNVLYETTVVHGFSNNADGGVASDEQTLTEFEYRDSEIALAFFKPILSTDSEGNLIFRFKVPNANTTWNLNALAFTKNLLSTSLTRSFVANKPVMVTPNLPRFLRSGDRADVSALVINNSDSTQSVVTTAEIFDAFSGKTIETLQSTDTIAAGQNKTVSFTVTAPTDASAIGVRIKSATDLFADGEQSLLPVLPSSQPVIEATPFYISPDSLTFSMQLPKIGDSARVTLEYCANPLWYVVTALPGLNQQKISTPGDAANTIFSAAVAEGILRDNPAIETALKEWNAGDGSDSTLVSMLSRNADLKTLLLQATPWMVDAMTDTQRMQRLALILDRSQIKDAYSRSIALLQRLQRAQGGWAWVSHSDEASLWATAEALLTLGRLNAMGYTPNDKSLGKMISQALSWHQSQIERQYHKYPSGNYYSFLRLRDLWRGFKPSLTGQTIINKEVQKIVRNWRKFTIGQKAEAVSLLAHNSYRTLSKTILSSIYEFAKTSPSQGMWWPSVGEQYGGTMTQLQISANILYALNEVDPASKYIDPIRQWLIIQKEARNWGTGSVTSEVISAIVSTSKNWIDKAGHTEISINQTNVPVNYTDSRLGYLRTDISSYNPSEALLTITKTAQSPSWGAVYSQSQMTMADIAAKSSDAVSIEKRIYLRRGTEWASADQLKVGDRVKIQLLITATRDMQYVAVDDNRSACFEPVEQLPAPIYSQGLCFYRENLDSSTRLFVTNMPKGTYMLEYEMWVNNAGKFSSGIATIQSQYAPQLTAHSAGQIIETDD